MRAGQTVVVCGADGDRAQFLPFTWPSHASVWIGVGCGNVCSIGYLSPSPSDASEHERVEVARSYVRAVRDTPRDVESAVLALAGWLYIIERAARVPCAIIVACGGVRVSALPIFRVWWTRRFVTVVGGGMKRTVRRECDVEACVREVIASRAEVAEYRIVLRGARSFELHPPERCALCATPIGSSFRRYVTAVPDRLTPVGADSSAGERAMWLPILSVCTGCSVRAFCLWRTFHFSLDGETLRVSDAPAATESPIFGQGAHESAWLANARVIETLALALVARAAPREGTFAASLAATMCDLKLLRIVAERMLPPAPRVVAQRALACLFETHAFFG